MAKTTANSVELAPSTGEYPQGETVARPVSPSALAREIANRIRGLREPDTTAPQDPAPNPAPAPVIPETETPGAEPITVEAATSDAPHEYVDDDNDGKCDICGKPTEDHDKAPAKASAFADEKKDEKPKADEPHDFVDDDGDKKCDICGKPAFVHKKASASVQHAGIRFRDDNFNATAGINSSGEWLIADNTTVELIAAPSAPTQDPVEIDPTRPGRFKAVLVVEEERTADNRIIAKGATKWRSPPLPLMLMTKTSDGHDGSEVAGVIERIRRAGNQIIGEGRFDTGGAGVEAARLVANGVLTGVSLDGGDAEREIIIEEEDDEGFPTKALERLTALTILGATVVPFPAIGSTGIAWLAPSTKTGVEDLETLADEECLECVEAEALTAGAPIRFPATMFADPKLDSPTPLRVDADGHVFGHAAIWGTCHTSFPGVCTTPPKSRTSYAHFLLKSLPLEGGGFQPVGAITIDGPHASDRLGAIETQAHYDNTGAIAAWINVGEDEHGIWVSGVLKPGISDEMATSVCGSNLSGDWRKIAGNLEMVALLGVPVPGFPVAYVKGDDQLSLVAAGFGPERRTKSLLAAELDVVTSKAEARFTTMQAEIDNLRDTVARLAEQAAPLIREHLARRLAEHV